MKKFNYYFDEKTNEIFKNTDKKIRQRMNIHCQYTELIMSMYIINKS